MYIDSGETAYMGEPHCAHFWVALTSNIQRAAAFMAKMIEKVAKYLEDPKKAIKRKSKDGIENLRRHMFYLKNTITLLGLYFDMHGTSAELQAAVERISKMTHIHMLDAEDQNLYVAMQQAVNAMDTQTVMESSAEMPPPQKAMIEPGNKKTAIAMSR